VNAPRWTGPAANVWALVCGLSLDQLERRTLVIWRAYLDDSGRADHSPVLVLGGWIAPISTWAEFVPHWDAMLEMPPRLEYFKMNEAAKLRGQFVSWSETRRDERVALAYKTIEEHIPHQVSVILELEPYSRIFTTDWVEDAARNPYYFAFDAIITGVAREQEKYGLKNPVDFVFDDQAREKGKIIQAWDALKVHADSRDLIGSVPAFLDDKTFKPLQAADLAAWWIRKLRTDEPDGVERVKMPWQSSRRIPGFQFHYDEARLLAVREATIASVRKRAGGSVQSS
jgi:hypothetical protein